MDRKKIVSSILGFAGAVILFLIISYAFVPQVLSGKIEMILFSINPAFDLLSTNVLDEYYKSDYKDNLLSNFWVCHFFTIENKMIMQNITINYNERTIAVDAFVEYDKEGNLKNSETFSYPKYNKIIPGTVGEDLLNFFFPKEHIKEIEIYLKDKDQN